MAQNGRGFAEQLLEASAECRQQYPPSAEDRDEVLHLAHVRQGPTIIHTTPVGQTEVGNMWKPRLPDGETRGIQSEVEFIKHIISGNETLEGLALKYQCQVSDIRKANGMIGPPRTLAGYRTVWIPLEPKMETHGEATDRAIDVMRALGGEGDKVSLIAGAEWGEEVGSREEEGRGLTDSDNGSNDCELGVPMNDQVNRM